MFLAHAPISYLTNESIQKEKISALKNSQQIFVAVLSIVFGILPDFDFFILMMMDRPSYTHHDFFTHTPIYWIGWWLILLLLSKLIYPHLNRKIKQFLTKDLLKIILNTFLIAGLSHLAADLLVSNIMLLYPITDRYFTILRYIFESSNFTGYFSSVYFAIEIVIIAIFFRVFSKKFFKKHKWDDIVSYVLITVSVLYLGFTIFMNVQTYNNSFLEDSDKPYIDYDMDYDTLKDIEDWDVDNDGIDNIQDANYENVVKNIEAIIDSNKLAVGEIENVIDRIYMQYGALNSYRIVSQAFYEDYSPIEPVIKNFYISNLEDKKYTVSFDYVEAFRDYLTSKNLLININLDSNPLLAPGRIFFLIDKNEDIMNMGMTLMDNDIAIVLPGENHVQNHTLDGLKMFYSDSIATFQILQ
jgi:inner membrane protein